MSAPISPSISPAFLEACGFEKDSDNGSRYRLRLGTSFPLNKFPLDTDWMLPHLSIAIGETMIPHRKLDNMVPGWKVFLWSDERHAIVPFCVPLRYVQQEHELTALVRAISGVEDWPKKPTKTP